MATKKKNDQGVMNPIEIWILLDRARFAIARLRGMELTQFGVTIEQSSILRTLYEGGGSLTTKELEEDNMRQPNSISILVNRMIKMGLVKREKTKSGKRYKIILTQEGENVIKKVTLASIEMTFSSLTIIEQQHLAEYLNKLLESARELLGIPHRPPFLKYLMENGHTKGSASKTLKYD